MDFSLYKKGCAVMQNHKIPSLYFARNYTVNDTKIADFPLHLGSFSSLWKQAFYKGKFEKDEVFCKAPLQIIFETYLGPHALFPLLLGGGAKLFAFTTVGGAKEIPVFPQGHWLTGGRFFSTVIQSSKDWPVLAKCFL